MTLANGRHYLAIPGPSVMPDRVLNAMHRAAPNIYEGELVEMMPGIVADLKAIARTTAQCAIYISNGHGAWEAALSNVVSPGDRVLVLATGRFAYGWSEVASSLGAECDIIDYGKRAPIDMAQVAEALAADTDHRIKAVMAVQVDTSTSVRSDIAALRTTMDDAGHPALLMVDCIASLACDDFRMDEWGVDVMVAACQKGLMVPPGLGFVFFNDKADRVRETVKRVSHYWDWRPRGFEEPGALWRYFDGTAPTHHLYGLRASLDMIGEEGFENVLDRHATLARAIWAAFETWGRDGPLELNIKDRALRSHAVTSLRIGAPYGDQLRDWTIANAGVTLGIGLGMVEANDRGTAGFFRVGHMGHVNAHMVLGMLSSIDAGLKALGIPHGKGALDAASTVCAAAAKSR
ncbi:pyridoxal-phosphate-dependent aminotransferase family protein [Oceaniglobus ichthyenteri]|uniref:pyridoxal-phosphate-dependent aminotransferase family protein n=1 Tax=Oceaniglobus ichthyenteri TaxID=2136177 RepID=UPI000D3BD5B5|nr:aminotransferase class V-fold PLP-dependent enzyme [Oceaniglobus ichthyenteri]